MWFCVFLFLCLREADFCYHNCYLGRIDDLFNFCEYRRSAVALNGGIETKWLLGDLACEKKNAICVNADLSFLLPRFD